jgi:hypothetical protein
MQWVRIFFLLATKIMYVRGLLLSYLYHLFSIKSEIEPDKKAVENK